MWVAEDVVESFPIEVGIVVVGAAPLHDNQARWKRSVGQMSCTATDNADRESTLMGGALLVVNGIVQGVGFRPYVYRLATQRGLSGWVKNSASGVEIAIAPGAEAESFRELLEKEPPPLAKILSVTIQPLGEVLPFPFEIRSSTPGLVTTGVAPDAALCPDCAAEMDDPADRRFAHAFLNCTSCGPRFSITRQIPYDRTNTSMGVFAMCADCADEFDDVTDRRFHAQPTSCPACGPKAWFEDRKKRHGGNAMALAISLIRDGGILALRGIGGFHLACLACDERAVATLRERKHRPTKPFATMVRDLRTARRYADISTAAAGELESPTAPIVLAPLLENTNLAPSVLCGLDRLGLMLPYSPLHRLLLAEFDEPLVMTSGNVGGAPQITGNDEARGKLGEIADGFVFHNREIVNRVDDSVVRLARTGPQALRRSRGLAPTILPIPTGFEGHPDAIAFGADLKNTFALACKGQAILSQHIGDLSDFETAQSLITNVDLLTGLFDCKPDIVVCDQHPDYRSTKLAEAYARERHLPVLKIQHHHAHAAAAMAEHGLSREAGVLALVQDGLGMGDDGGLWGAEMLQATYGSAIRLATLLPAPLPGGDAAAYEPWRNLVARLHQTFGSIEDWPIYFKDLLKRHPAGPLVAAISAGINAPKASSAGRLFDAVASALKLAPARQSYEAEAAMRLEMAARRWIDRHGPPAPFNVAPTLQEIAGGQMIIVDPSSIWRVLATDMEANGADCSAARFHVSWAKVWAHIAGEQTNDNSIVLSGGTFQNQLLAEMTARELEGKGKTVLEHRDIPANDGGIALGQLMVGLARHQGGTGDE